MIFWENLNPKVLYLFIVILSYTGFEPVLPVHMGVLSITPIRYPHSNVS